VVIISQNERQRLPISVLEVIHASEEMGVQKVSVTVIDNASHDGSDEIVETMAKTIHSLKLIRFETALSPAELVNRALSEVQGEYLLLFISPGAVPFNLESYFRETGGQQFSSFVGEVPRLSFHRPERWFSIITLKLADWIHPRNILRLRTFGVLLHKPMADDLVKNWPPGVNNLQVLQQSLVNVGAVSKTHVVAGAPLFGFSNSALGFLNRSIKAYFLRRRS